MQKNEQKFDIPNLKIQIDLSCRHNLASLDS